MIRRWLPMVALTALAPVLDGCAAHPAARPAGPETTDSGSASDREDGRTARAGSDELGQDAAGAKGSTPANTSNAAAAGKAASGPSTQAPGPSDTALRKQFANHRVVRTIRGQSAYYHDSLAGNRTASGERYDPAGFTAAHRTLPFGTVLRVRRAKGTNDVYVRVTDRGPFGKARLVLDLSRAAAERIGLIRPGVAEVVIEVLQMGAGPKKGRR